MAKKKAPNPKEQKPPPVCKAILLCDRVIIDARTGEYTVIGIFDQFEVAAFPGRTRGFAVYVQLTSGIGSYEISFEIQDLQNNTTAARTSSGPKVEFPDRSAKAHMIAELPAIPLAHPGIFDFVVLANGQEIDRQQFTARARDKE
jgi:hypothetical protein